jgi:hypothetical protein
MPECVRAADIVERELPRERLGAADLLVDLDHAPGAHHAQVGAHLDGPALDLVRVRLDDDAGVRRPNRGLPRAAERLAERCRDHAPVLARVGRVERDLRRSRRRLVAIEGDAGAVRPAVGQLHEHGGEVGAEPSLDLPGLREHPHDPAHEVEGTAMRFPLCGQEALENRPLVCGNFTYRALTPQNRVRYSRCSQSVTCSW